MNVLNVEEMAIGKIQYGFLFGSYQTYAHKNIKLAASFVVKTSRDS